MAGGWLTVKIAGAADWVERRHISYLAERWFSSDPAGYSAPLEYVGVGS